MRFSLTLETDSKAMHKMNFFNKVAFDLENYLLKFDYGTSIENFIVGFIIIDDPTEDDKFFQPRKPRYKEQNKVNLLDGTVKIIERVFTCDIKLDNRQYNDYIEANEEKGIHLIASELIGFLRGLNKMPTKVTDFDKLALISDLESFFSEIKKQD